MSGRLSTWSLAGLCASMGVAVGGGLYEHLVIMPQWSSAPPSSFALIQPDTGVPLQRFWIPVHAAITLCAIAALVTTWKDRRVRGPLLAGLASYAVMRGWSAAFFIPEMLDFQQVPLDAAPTPELLARVKSWTTWTWWRQPLDLISLGCWMLAFYRWRRPAAAVVEAQTRAA